MAIFDNLDRALRWLREARRVRQYQVAEAAGITKAMLSSYETGKQKPSLETLDKILTALRCELRDLDEVLDVFRAPPGKRPRGALAAAAMRPFPPATPAEGPRGGPAETDLRAALGIDHPLESGEEEALRAMLDSFHRLLGHMHRSAAAAREPDKEEPGGEPGGGKDEAR